MILATLTAIATVIPASATSDETFALSNTEDVASSPNRSLGTKCLSGSLVCRNGIFYACYDDQKWSNTLIKCELMCRSANNLSLNCLKGKLRRCVNGNWQDTAIKC
jgi:hypothetical protein